MKLLFSLVIAAGFVICIILAAEGICSIWQMLAGFVIFFLLSFVGAQWRHPITVFPLALLAMLIVYFGVKYAWFGLIPGGVLGAMTTLLLSVGWINPHEPFSRDEYKKRMAARMTEKEDG